MYRVFHMAIYDVNHFGNRKQINMENIFTDEINRSGTLLRYHTRLVLKAQFDNNGLRDSDSHRDA